MNQEICVRRALPSDSESVLNLLHIIADIHRNARPDMFPNLVSKYDLSQVQERLSMENSGVFVAVLDDKVIGYVFCDIITEGDGKTLYVDDLCVNPSVRNHGIGRSLMDRAALYGRESGCRFLMLNVWEFNEAAIRFYENYGLKTRSRHLEMKL